MRITNRMTYESSLGHIQANQDVIAADQEMINGGKMYNASSDNPVEVATILNLHSKQTESKAYLQTIATSKEWLTANETALTSLNALVSRATTIIQKGINDTLGPGERRDALSIEMDGILKEALDIGNSKHQDSYLFAGFQTRSTTAPFVPIDADTIQNNSQNDAITRFIEPGRSIQINLNGTEIFPPVYQALIAARNALRDNQPAAMSNALGSLTTASAAVTQNTTLNGGRIRHVTSTEDRMKKIDSELKALVSSKEDTNMVEAISHLTNQQSVYQAVLEVSSRAISALSLFDILR